MKSHLHKMIQMSVLALSVVFTLVLVAAQDFDNVEIKTTRVAPSIYMLEGEGGNIGVCVGRDGVLMVDDQYAPLTGKIKAAIARLSEKPIEFVINTHWHFDHCGGNENLGTDGTVIVAQENSRKRMSTEQLVGNRTQKAYQPVGLPKVTFSESLSLHYNDEAIQLFHLANAHTDGDAFVHFANANVIHAGDVFVRYGFPFIDERNGGDIDGMLKMLDRMAALSDESTKIIPGHGELATKRDLLTFTDMLRTIRNRVSDGIGAGKSFEDIVASDPTGGFEERGVAKADFIRSIHNSLSR